MSEVSERIAFYWAGRGNPDFLTPRSRFTDEDEPLLSAGVFTVAAEELKEIDCPWGCGEREAVVLLRKQDGTLEHFCVCQEGEGMMVLKPEQYQLMAFHPDAYLRFCQGLPSGRKTPPPKKRRGPKDTPFMRYQRKATMAYITEACQRPLASLTLADCHHVWNLPRHKPIWDKRAKLKNDTRGYSGPKAIFHTLKHQIERLEPS